MAELIGRLWGPAVVTCSVDAPVHEVFEVIADPTTYPDWLVGAKRIRHVDPRWPRPGTRFEHEVGGGPVRVHDETEATLERVDRELRLIARARPLFEADVRFEVEPADAGTIVRMSERPRGVFAVATPLVRPLVHGRNRRSLQRLAEYVERRTRSGPAAPRP